VREDLEKVYKYFPRLKERRNSAIGLHLGREQQMTAIGRALMARPNMILLDEPSMVSRRSWSRRSSRIVRSSTATRA